MNNLHSKIMRRAELPDTPSGRDLAEINVCLGEEQENARLLPLIEALAKVAGCADQLGKCFAEFDDCSLYCAEYVQHLDDALSSLAGIVGD